MNYRQNHTIQLTSRYGFRIWQRDDGKQTFSASFTLAEEDLRWPIDHCYSLTQDDLYRMYVFIGSLLESEYVSAECNR